MPYTPQCHALFHTPSSHGASKGLQLVGMIGVCNVQQHTAGVLINRLTESHHTVPTHLGPKPRTPCTQQCQGRAACCRHNQLAVLWGIGYVALHCRLCLLFKVCMRACSPCSTTFTCPLHTWPWVEIEVPSRYSVCSTMSACPAQSSQNCLMHSSTV